ncbi:hypothetical protein pEaSNUABM50_00351 [Erwinia phage pEa_SNUABM_50]|uniref:Uncharacterized protein n=4 Tax=Eneladusvirus BF TaxID=2560751 RepID=A0A7L8ZMX3_9CAUD|nr:hypothetical protein FDH34_gp355 [Serratia phage BF]QOI71293.1 hypothetical protein pEaSNUABM12_00355 [Erwinia phage pEa_SNUABM_12]QOI71836.1 hypothetical protein pEaSNUABM47_00352 [Erwinia phage pEa_SNUABM_47]QOI72375.1 hypothetical protein pEaSNUABM50_00351 [Erwinia phage pEa_SNUABM_50]QXO11502.1 hypothetical protein pEaSNUABM19_00356 [Erwinia phage pEa_SNUABM_19]QXO12050.1 hypothetical protein pEaSNUABM44_00354 [Erwinia phage pEa_SNUABM_44]QXO12602.1 hypothetical protein pEaSNUABM49_003
MIIVDNIFEFHPISELREPFDGSQVYMNRYWIVKDDCVLRYIKHQAWQCNAHEFVIQSAMKDNPIYEGCSIVFFPYLYIPR